MNEAEKDKKEVLYFYCEESLKSDFYKMTQEKKISPGSLFRAFMRKAVKNWAEEKKIKQSSISNEE